MQSRIHHYDPSVKAVALLERLAATREPIYTDC